jgi:hypothetical protein
MKALSADIACMSAAARAHRETPKQLTDEQTAALDAGIEAAQDRGDHMTAIALKRQRYGK